MSDGDEATPTAETELIRRLRQRADQLRAGQTLPAPRPAPEPEPEPAPEPAPAPWPEPAPEPEPEPASAPAPWPEPEPEPPPDSDDVDGDPFVGWDDLSPTVDPDSRDLLSQWADEEHIQTESPDRNWSPLILLVVLLVVAAIVFAGVRFALAGDSDDVDAGARGADAEAPSVTDADPPSLDELTSEVTVPPGPAEGLSVGDKGITIVEDRFDPERREGTFAVIVDNPHAEWLAQGVRVDVNMLDETGAEVGADSAFVEVILPGQKVAVGTLFFDAPTVPVVDLAVTLDVARWRETGGFEGGFTIGEVVTEEAEFSGVRTTFPLRSDFDEALTDTGVTAVYRGPDGRIVGGSDTFVDLLDPGVDTPVEITLLANIPLDQITATEIYPAAGFGFVPDQ